MILSASPASSATLFARAASRAHAYIGAATRRELERRQLVAVEEACGRRASWWISTEPSVRSGEAISRSRPRFAVGERFSSQLGAMSWTPGWIQICRKCTGSVAEGLNSLHHPGARAHALNVAGPDARAVPDRVLVRELPREHVADDLHVVVNGGAEAGAGLHAVLVDHA